MENTTYTVTTETGTEEYSNFNEAAGRVDYLYNQGTHVRYNFTYSPILLGQVVDFNGQLVEVDAITWFNDEALYACDVDGNGLGWLQLRRESIIDPFAPKAATVPVNSVVVWRGAVHVVTAVREYEGRMIAELYEILEPENVARAELDQIRIVGALSV